MNLDRPFIQHGSHVGVLERLVNLFYLFSLLHLLFNILLEGHLLVQLLQFLLLQFGYLPPPQFLLVYLYLAALIV